MSDQALVSQGMTIGIGDGASPEVYTTINEINTISGPGGSASEIDVTDLNSTAKEFRLGLSDSGTITLALNYIPANVQHALLRSRWVDGVITNFRITFTDSPNTLWTFAAFVQELSVENGVDAVTTGSVTLRVSGSITES